MYISYIYIYMYISYLYIVYVYIYIYIYIIFSTEELFEVALVALENWPEWDLNP